MIAILDCHYRILHVNQAMADRLGTTPDQCVGRLCYEVIHGTKGPPHFCPHAHTINDGLHHAVEMHEIRLEGDFLVTTTPLTDESDHVIGAVHVARDITEQKRTQDKLKRLLTASDHERQLVSCEIHDGLAQQLSAAMMHFDAYGVQREQNPSKAAEEIAAGVRLVRESHAEARRLIGGLQLSQLQEGGILQAVENLVRHAADQYHKDIEFSGKVDFLRLDPMLEKNIFRIVEECLANACRHSKSKKVKVGLTQINGQLRIEVQDWGVGFHADRVKKGHFGLESIQERAQIFGGHAVVKSHPRQGTAIVVDLPLQGPNEDKRIY
jgi:PAS domain S-box-containing protein